MSSEQNFQLLTDAAESWKMASQQQLSAIAIANACADVDNVYNEGPSAVSQVDIPKSRQSPQGSHCRGVYTPEIVTQEGGRHLLTRDNVWLFERLT